MKTFVLTSDHHAWLLRGFLHQWEKYDGRLIEAVGFTDPGHAIMGKIPFVSIGNFSDYPVNKWSDALIRYLKNVKDDLVEIYLEDYWLIRETNLPMISEVDFIMRANPSVARFDLGSDRLYSKGVRDVGSVRSMDLIEGKGDTSCSFQAAIWQRSALLSLLKPGESPWQAELEGTTRMNLSKWRCLGCRQIISRYLIYVNKGVPDRSGMWMVPPRTLSQSDWKELDRLGYTEKPA
jgi:hypothetical protein